MKINARKTIELTTGWQFVRTELGTTQMPADGWQTVTVPHDWAITGSFSPDHDPQPLEDSVLDYHPNVIHLCRSGGLPVYGVGWYKIALDLPEGYASYIIEFDGIMSRGEVWFNGVCIGQRPYGYSSFAVDLTPYARFDQPNELIVKVNALTKTSRWYPGAGIYRPVRLVMKPENHILYNGVWARPEVALDKDEALVQIQVRTNAPATVQHKILDPNGALIAEAEGTETQVLIPHPQLWNTETPHLYTLVSSTDAGDEVRTRFGIRKAQFTADCGFLLNGRQMKINGVCMHHDFGMLGAAWNESAARRQLELLKEMGCNGLRTTHNPPQPTLLDLCDEMGIVVMEEAFDEWHIGKEVNGYHLDFDAWAERDLRDMIERDRNHPSIVIYSIGNEIPDQTTPEGKETCRFLTRICHETDDSRPVTCGFNRPDAAIENGLADEVDVIGINYNPGNYQKYHDAHPEWVIMASETVSCISSRGEYFQPAVKEMPVIKHDNYQVNSYDWSAPPFCYIPDMEFDAQKKAPFVGGCFVWTGFDYLGEPTPYRTDALGRSSYFGILDLAGMKKDRYYAYAANWTDTPVLHLLPHWNWAPGTPVDVHCYTNLEQVELFLNGRQIPLSRVEGFRWIYEQIPFEAGELKAIGYKDGQKVMEDVVHTAGAPAKLRLIENWNRDGLVFVEAQILDQEGHLCPNAACTLHFEVTGAGKYLASDNGNPIDTRTFSEPWCNAFHGKAMIACAADDAIFVRVSGDGIEATTIQIQGGKQ